MASTSFVDVPSSSPFSINNIPFGIFSTESSAHARPGVAIGDLILDLAALVRAGVFEKACPCQFDFETLTQCTLNAFAALGRGVLSETRTFLQSILSTSSSILRDDHDLQQQCLIKQSEATMHLPFFIGDYTDFLNSPTHAKRTHSSHATPVNMFSPPRAFCGQASSVVPSGTPIVRPLGHVYENGNSGKTVLAPSNELDVELEMACFVSKPTAQFKRVSVTDAEEHIFGLVILNDWSTRDIQRGEDFPFGAFSCKSFASTISPWVVTLDALEPFREKPNARVEDDVLPYLDDPSDTTYDIHLRMDWKLAETDEVFQIARTELKNTYWTFRQMLAFQTLSGAPMRTGDLIGTGTMTGPEWETCCSLVERTDNGKNSITSPKGTIRKFVEDGDEITFTAWCREERAQSGVGFGDCVGCILPAQSGST